MTEAELEIMETLWAKGEPIYLGELLEVFNARTNKDWKKQTLNTFLVKMQQKNLVQAVEGARFKKLSLKHISEPTRRTPITYAVFC